MFFGIRLNNWLRRRQVVPQTVLLLSLIIVAGIAISSASGKADDSLSPAQATTPTTPTRSDRAVVYDDTRSPRPESGSSVPTTSEARVDAPTPSYSRDSVEIGRQRHILEILILRDIFIFEQLPPIPR